MKANILAQKVPASNENTMQVYARQRARLFSALLLAFFPVALVILLVWNLANPAFQWARVLTLVIIIIYLASYRLSRSQYYRVGVVFLIVLLQISVLIVMAKAPRPYVERLPSLAFFSVAVLLASVLLSIRATVITLIISTIAIVVLLTVNNIPFDLTFVFLAFMFCVAVLSIVSAYIQLTVLLELDYQKKELTERETLFRELAERSPDIILFVNPMTSTIMYSNLSEFLGYTQTEPLELQQLRAITHPDDLDMVVRYWANKDDPSSGNAPHEIEFRVRSKTGIWEWIHSRYSVISRVEDGRADKVLITSSIVTDRKKENLRQMQVSLEHERVKILTDFIRDASHEFRTPLSTIVTNLYMLRQQRPSDSDRKLIKGIEQQAFSITTLVDAMTLLAKLSSDVTLELEVYPINVVIDESNVRACPSIINKGHRLLTELADPSPTILADRRLFAEAFRQLIDNASHHTSHAGTITVRTFYRDDSVGLEVQDNGIGITEAILPRIFDTFFRADSAHTTAGFGLGLSVVKRIVERLNGRVEVETELGTGSTFRLCFPPYSSDIYPYPVNHPNN